MTEQTANLNRVSEKIRSIVRAFFADKAHGRQFTINELTRFVSLRESVAPDSPGRIMRALRREGSIDYEVVSRSKSLYRVVGLGQRELWE